MMEENKQDLQETENQDSITAQSENSVEDTENKMRIELEEQKDKYIRLVAEFDNFRRRTAKERIDLIQTAGKDIIVSLLEILDDCDRAEKQIKSDNGSSSLEGTLLVFNKLRNILQQKGLKAMDSLHTEFDVEKHEAITELEVADELKGKVIDVLEKGYYLNEKIIRFAKVVVGK